MASEWIKVRQELFTHPKFLALCSRLIFDDAEHGLLIYSCGDDALGVGVVPPSSETIIDRASRCVTERALRAVTMETLLRVWCAVNAHCKIIGADAVMSPFSVFELDSIAGFAGFGDAMTAVGWVIRGDDNSLIFPNFREFNEPACLRKPAESDAERQRRYRARKRGQEACHEVSRSVTNVTTEKSREEQISDSADLQTAVLKKLAKENWPVATLRDDRRLFALHARIRELLPAFAVEPKRFFAAADHVAAQVAKGKKLAKPMGLFFRIVFEGRWKDVTDEQLTNADRRIAALRARGQPQRESPAAGIAGAFAVREPVPAQPGG